MTLTEALARDMFANEHDDAAPGAIDEAWADDADLRAFWTTRSTAAITFMVEWRVQARNAAAPPSDITYASAEVWDDIHSDDAPTCACPLTACFYTVEYESRRCCPTCTH